MALDANGVPIPVFVPRAGASFRTPSDGAPPPPVANDVALWLGPTLDAMRAEIDQLRLRVQALENKGVDAI